MSKALSPLLRVRNLKIGFDTPDAYIEAVKGISLDIQSGDCLGLVGESGSGKSQTALAIAGLLADNSEVSGEIYFQEQDLLKLTQKDLRDIRGRKISMIFQDPLTCLTPHMCIGTQMMEGLRRHFGHDKHKAQSICLEWLERVRIPEAKRRLAQFPHELSGGMRQRVMIAMAMMVEPDLLICDEPTTALDATVQAQILTLMRELSQNSGTSMLLITHDMGVVARMCDQVSVMRQGQIVEQADANTLFYKPKDDYTKMLLDATPRLDEAVKVTSLDNKPDPQGNNISDSPLLSVKDIKVQFPVSVPGGLFGKQLPLKAVDGISFDLYSGETLGVVGESGCGKSTLARAILRLINPKSGAVSWLGRDIAFRDEGDLRSLRDQLQIVFQDPLASLNPRMPIGRSIAEPLSVFRPELDAAEREIKVKDMMERVGLSTSFFNRYPHELSGGQNQRVGIARAMILRPKLVVCDEAVSALDVSVQAQIIDLLIDLQREFSISMIFISHDLSVVRQISHKVMVLYLGRVVEMATGAEIFEHPHHPYTKALLSAALTPDPKLERERPHIRLEGDLPSPLDPRAVLRFMPSKLAEGQEDYRPKLNDIGNGHWVAEFDPA